MKSTRVREEEPRGDLPLRKKVAGNVGKAAKFLSVIKMRTVQIITVFKKSMKRVG